MSPLFTRFLDCNIKSTLESPESSSSTSGTTRKLKRFHSYATLEPEIFVGFREDVDLLVGHLVNERDDCFKIVSICGMGGLGKTTLAEKIYNNSTIKTYFAGLAWVSISQKWQRKQVLQRILICLVHEKKEEILTYDEDKLVENLLQIQQSKKCLIVLDDIWSKDAWDSLKAAFPDEMSRSRLMLTSRNENVAEHANPNGFIHRPVLLNLDQSWKLLDCDGLPLAMLGGILVTKPSLIEWEKVYDDSLSSRNRGRGLGEKYQSQISEVLVWSYDDLPLQLKPCFLYLGKYNEDESIDAETLYQLWIAEGMVLSSDKREGETMMQVAESYLGELVHRSMVQVTFNDLESSRTKFKSCSLHDLMRDLSLSRAKAEDFFETIDLREGNDFHHNCSVVSTFANTRQLVVYYQSENPNSFFTKKPNHEQYRSILLVHVDWGHISSYRLGSYLANFKFLRVLALEYTSLDQPSFLGTLFGTNMGKLLGSLVHLRYLSLMGSELNSFSWIHKLVLLQTLKLNIYYDNKPLVWGIVLGKLSQLRHLYLPHRVSVKLRENFKLRFNGLSKLETLENFDTKWCEVKDLPELSSLRRLKLTAEGSYDDVKETLHYLSGIALSSNSCIMYLTIDIGMHNQGFKNDADIIRQLLWNHKINLQGLSIDGQLAELFELFEQQQQQLNHTRIDESLIRITKLVLSRSWLEEDPMPVLEKIPTLRDLSLLLWAYEGKEMVCSAMGFPKLVRLYLGDLTDLERWRVEEGSMPILQRLVIDDCPKLEELPQGLIFLNSLQTLDLHRMPWSFRCRVRMPNGEKGPDFYKVAHIPDLNVHSELDE